MNLYKVKVNGEVLVRGDTHGDVKTCLRGAKLECGASTILYLDVDRIELIPEPVEEEHPHPHPHE